VNPTVDVGTSQVGGSNPSVLPTEERARLVERVRVLYPRWKAIEKEIVRCHEMSSFAAEPHCLLVVGPTGVGKTTLAASYALRYPRIETETGVEMPVLHATIPTAATVKDLSEELLSALGDPRASLGTTGQKSRRLSGFLRDCGTRLLILDETQHFVDRDSRRVLLNASNWLKSLVKETGVACVLVGLEGEAESVVSTNPQLARLFGDPLVLAPFEWDEERPDTVEEFGTFLEHLERLLPLRESSHLADRDTARRIFLASDGLMSHVMALVRGATHLALARGSERLDLDLLAAAFDHRLAGRRRAVANPFQGELPPSSGERGTPRPVEATNRRSRVRGPRRERLADVLGSR
jgi:hypothetical protein